MGEITYQNKDVASKVVGEALVGRSLAPFGLPNLTIKGILPTNLSVVESNELRLDNLFLLQDKAVAILDYESEYSKENFVKYLNYTARVIRRYAKQKKLDELAEIKIIVIYTADVESAWEEYDLKGVRIKIEAAYLVHMDTENIYEKIKSKIHDGDMLTEEEVMELMILPLTVKGKENKQEVIIKAVELAKKLINQKQRLEVLAGILTFTDKVIDENYREKVKEEMEMTQVGQMIFDDGVKHGEKIGEKRGERRGERRGAKRGQELKLIDLICRKLRKGKRPEQIAEELEEDMAIIVGICKAASGFAPDYDCEKVYRAWKKAVI